METHLFAIFAQLKSIQILALFKMWVFKTKPCNNYFFLNELIALIVKSLNTNLPLIPARSESNSSQ